MLPKQLIKDYFSFTRKDRIFTISVVTVIGGSLIIPQLWSPSPKPIAIQPDSTLALAIDTLQQRQSRKTVYTRNENPAAYQFERSMPNGFAGGELFSFDPNTASFEDWQRMGLNARTSKTIINYLSKGGKFYKPEDLQKIWSMPEGFFERVKSYVRIAAVKKEYTRFSDDKPAFVKEERKPALVSVNSTDTSALIALPGIGSKLAARIITFREKLGGFYTVDQVGETYGLPDSTFQKIKGRLTVDANTIRKINVNMATKDDLKSHPYIKWALANAIVEYRNQHGSFTNLEELKNIVLIDNATFQRISPYLNL